MELFDIYDKDHVKTERSQYRGLPLTDGDYGLIVHVWIQNSEGKYIITKRAKHKSFGGLWECPGGGAVSGECSLEAALREVQEETGLWLDPSCGRIVKFCVYEEIRMICDVWLFNHNIGTNRFALQTDEASDIMAAKPDEIRSLIISGEFVPVYGYMDWFLDEIAIHPNME